MSSTNFDGVYVASGRGQNAMTIKSGSYEIDHSNLFERGNIALADEQGDEGAIRLALDVIRSDKRGKPNYEIVMQSIPLDGRRLPLIMTAFKDQFIECVQIMREGKPFPKKPGIYFRYENSVDEGNRGEPGNPPCPECGEPLMTPKAQQCFACGADWH